MLKYFNARQSESMATELPINQLFLAHDEDKTPEERISQRFLMRNLTRNIEYRISMRTRVKMLKDDPDRPGLKIEEFKESHSTSWTKVYTSAKIFTGEFNFTQILYEPFYKDPKHEKTINMTKNVQDTVNTDDIKIKLCQYY